MENGHILKQIASLEKAHQKLMRNFQKIVGKEDDNTLIEQERIDALLDIIKVFDHKINELKALIEKNEQNPE
jgi:transposase